MKEIPVPDDIVVDDDVALQVYKPVLGNVLIKRLYASGKSKGGILLPGNLSAKSKRTGRGKVMSLPDALITAKGVHVEIDFVKPGDIVLFSEYDVTEIINGGEHILVKATNIYCVIEGDEFQ